MGRNVADYSIVKFRGGDGTFTIDAAGGSEVEMNVRLRRGALRDLSSILTFVIRGAQDLRLRVNINNNIVLEENIGDGSFERTLQEVFPARTFQRFDNEIRFEAIRGRGSFSDLVLWYRRNST
jgi:hypothetical protein